jgi:uncharacterized protein YraI
MHKRALTLLILTFFLMGCNQPASVPTIEPVSPTQTFSPTQTSTFPPPTLTQTLTPLPPTETSAPPPLVDEIKASVTADKLVCRYGPGANYLYLIALNKTTPLKLIGRAPGNDWVLVENGEQDCWVNSESIEAQENLMTLRPMYPDGYKIPVSPYYGPTTVLSATRAGDQVTINWVEIVVSPGKYENDYMFPYIVEVWVCKDGEIIFDTLGSRVPYIIFTDEAGCEEPSRGRVYIQEKHGYAGPAEIPWPEK